MDHSSYLEAEVFEMEVATIEDHHAVDVYWLLTHTNLASIATVLGLEHQTSNHPVATGGPIPGESQWIIIHSPPFLDNGPMDPSKKNLWISMDIYGFSSGYLWMFLCWVFFQWNIMEPLAQIVNGLSPGQCQTARHFWTPNLWNAAASSATSMIIYGCPIRKTPCHTTKQRGKPDP